MNYQPKPVDTSGIDLWQLGGLSEYLAEQGHEVWAERRMAEGWTYGPLRDEVKKQSPNLVPYSQLPESEREYDRKMSAHTLKLMRLQGYQIQPPDADALPVQDEGPGTPDESDMVDEKELEWLKSRVEQGGSNLQPLMTLLEWLKDELLPDYQEAEKKAVSQQKAYLRASLGCTIFAGIAVFLAIYQLAGFPTFGLPPLALPVVELVLVALAGGLVLLDFQYKWRDSWLTNRSRAERFRALKFNALLDPRMWSVVTRAEAEASLRGKVRALNAMDPEQLAAYAEDAGLNPPIPALLSNDAGLDQAIGNYYLRRRLITQADYTATKVHEYHKADRRTRLLGTVLFFLVLTFVFTHVVIDIVKHAEPLAEGSPTAERAGEPQPPRDGPEKVGRVLIVLAAILPAAGAALHVYRSGREAGRNHLRSRANRKRLDEMRTELEKPCSIKEQIRLMMQSEIAVSSEHQQWLQLMKECEWYG